jgi:uncharacterized membrane protein
MKTAMAILMVAMLALSVVVGCGSPKGGGMSSDEGFRISTPFFTTDIQQGDRKTVTVSVKRDEFFKQAVRLQVSASSGISVTPTDVLVKASDTPEVQLQIAAPKDAALGEYRVHIKGTPETGQPTSTEIKVKVVGP